MTDQDAFLRSIQADPSDNATRLIYADWLEEHGQSARAKYLRLWAEKGPQVPRNFDRAWSDLVAGHVPLWDAPTLLAMGRLEGLLQAYAQVNEHWSDISYDFIPTLVRPSGPLAEQVQMQFEECFCPVFLEKVPDWKTAQRDVLQQWLFESLRNVQPGPVRLAFHDEERRYAFVDTLIHRLEEVIQTRTAWRIRITGNSFYALTWDDFVLEAEDRLLFLHFSLTD